MSAGVTITGLAQAKANVRLLDMKNHRGAERDGLRSGANALAKNVRKRAPRRTGRLRRSATKVSVSVTNDKAEAQVKLSRVARFLEMGTSRMRPHPFVRPAIPESEDAIVEAYGKAYIRSVERRISRA